MLFSAIDTGGTKIAYAVIDENGVIYEKDRCAREGRMDRDYTMQKYGEIIQMHKEKYPIAAVGLGAGGRIDVHTGICNYVCIPNTGWEGTNIVEDLQKICGLPVAIENDCKIALIGEHWKGAVEHYDTILGFFIGTGLGGGYLYQDKMVYGHRYGAGEIGHSILYPNGKKCTCGQMGCAERYISGTALWKNYNEKKEKNRISSGYEFFEKLKNGDCLAEEVLESFAEDLANLLISYANLFDPQVILIGGGIADTQEYWWNKMLEYYHQNGSDFIQSIPIVPAALKNDAALLGAAKIAMDKVKRSSLFEK